MDNEVFDIVDEEDNIIGECTRKEAHTEGHLHRSVFFFIFDREGKIFVNQRSKTKEFYPEYWSIVFGGHVPKGESYEDAVVREAEEEAGIKGEPFYIGFMKKRIDKEDQENIKIFGFTAESELVLDTNEVTHGQFITIEELEKKLLQENFLPETKEVFRILKEFRANQS